MFVHNFNGLAIVNTQKKKKQLVRAWVVHSLTEMTTTRAQTTLKQMWGVIMSRNNTHGSQGLTNWTIMKQ